MTRVRILAITVLLFSSTLPSAFGGSFQSPPSNLTSFRNNLANSIVEVRCGTTYSVGFAGNYNITSAMKDKGQNSLILTSGTGIANCRSSLKSSQITYKGATSTADTYFQNGSNPDFASIITSVNIPTLQLYGTTIPESGWWVDVVRSVPGFGLVWESSHIKFVNPEKLTFTIDQITPGVVDNALVFANDGQFIGMLSSFGTSPITGQVVVQGAPLQCQLSKSNSSPTVTICGKLATEIWVGPGIVETTPTQVTNPADSEVQDASDAVRSAISQLQAAQNRCDALVSEIQSEQGDFEFGNTILIKCSANQDIGPNLESKLFSIEKSTSSVQDKLKKLNSLTDESLAQIDRVEQISASLEEVQPIFNDISGQLNQLVDAINLSTEKWENLMNRISGLPKINQAALVKLPSYKLLESKLNFDSSPSEFIQNAIPDLLQANSPNRIQLLNQSIVKFKKSNLLVLNPESAIQSISKVIPNFVCIKGSTVSTIPATGKCASGSRKTSTK